MKRMGLSAKSYIVSRNSTVYDETDINNSSLFLRTLCFNTRFSTNQVLQKWMQYLKKTVYINMFDKNSRHSQMIFISYSTNLLSNSILRPDLEYGVEFLSGTGSCVYRFSKQQPRIVQNIEKMYISDIFSGIPDYHED